MASTRTSPSHGKVSAVIAIAFFGLGAAGGLNCRPVANHDHAANTGRLLGTGVCRDPAHRNR